MKLPAAATESDGRRRVAAALAELPAGGPAQPRQRQEWIMGHVMRALRGRVPGRLARNIVKEARS